MHTCLEMATHLTLITFNTPDGLSFNHTLVKNTSFYFSTHMGSYSQPNFEGPAFLLALFHSSNPPPSRSNVLTCIPSSTHPLWDSASSLVHRLVFDSDTIGNSTRLSLVDIVLFGFFFLDFPSRFLKCVW